MFKLYCPCSYPIWVSARWNGSDIVLLLHDGQQEPNREADSLTSCPHCHRQLTPAELTWLAPPALPWRALLPEGRLARDGASPRKILVVDDDEDIRVVMQEILAEAGFQVQGPGTAPRY